MSGVVCGIVAIKKSPQGKNAPPLKDDSSAERNVSVGQDIKNSRVITGDQNPTDTHGDVVYGNKIERHVHQGETFVVSSVHQIPAPPRDFTGRKEELSDLLANVGRGATISGVRGLGGVGKTTLALKVCEAIKPRYPDGQIYLDLKGVTDHQTPVTSNEAMLNVIRAYEPLYRQPDSDNELRGKYRSVLDGKRVLLLMDNAARRDQVEPLLPPESCAMIVTSRQHFTLPGMKATDLDAMTPADARELLLKIASEIGERANDLAEMCGRLPLALRLAASAIAESGMKVEDYLRRLKDARKRMELIDASISLSCELLTGEQRKLWSALAVFPDSFDIAAAGAVWEMDYDAALDALSELKKRSLIDLKEGRYRMHDLARLCADARLSDDERNDAQRRHAAYFKDVLTSVDKLYRAGGEESKRGLRLLDEEWKNIQAGQSWAESKSDADDEAADLSIGYAHAESRVLDFRQHPRQRIHWTEVALKAAKRLKRRGSEGNALCVLGLAYRNLGEAKRAIKFYEEYLAIVRELDNRHGEGNALGNLGLAYAALGETRKAIEFFEQQLIITREIGDRRGEGNALWNMSLSLDKLGERERAIESAKSALKIYEEIESPYTERVREQLDEWRGSDEK